MYYLIRRIISNKKIECKTYHTDRSIAYAAFIAELHNDNYPSGQRVELIELELNELSNLSIVARGRTKGVLVN